MGGKCGRWWCGYERAKCESVREWSGVGQYGEKRQDQEKSVKRKGKEERRKRTEQWDRKEKSEGDQRGRRGRECEGERKKK